MFTWVPVPVWIAATLARELVRALLFPVHLLLFLTRYRAAQARARELLEQPPTDVGMQALEPLFARAASSKGDRPHIVISAGEASGELHAAGVMQAVAAQGTDVRWSCFGGSQQRDAGGSVVFELSEHAIMGLSGVLRALPFLVRAYHRFLRLLRDDPPDLIVLVDYPGLHLVFGRAARLHGVPVLHFIAPQYWAWAPWRLRRYRGCVDACLTILPFESRFYADSGVPSRYVGHPLLDHLQRNAPDREVVDELRQRPILCLMPGSRRGEITANIAPMTALARRMRAARADLRVVIVHTAERRGALIRELLDGESADDVEVRIGPLGAWLRSARVVLAKSGTGSLEATLCGAATVVIYQLKGALAEWFYRHFLSVPWVAAPNLVAGRRIVDEYVFREPETWQQVGDRVESLLTDDAAHEAYCAELEELRSRMGVPGATERAAACIVEFCGRLVPTPPTG